MACYTCGNGGCLCGSSVDISAIKGAAGANGTNGVDGNGIVSIVAHPTLPDTWIITYTNGTVVNVATPPTTGGGSGSGTDTYWAWADDASGTGFTLTPSDKSHFAITDTVATTGSPIASDFSTKWFMINQPAKSYDAAKWIDYSMTIPVTTGDVTFSPAPATAASVPVAYFDSVGSYIEFETTLVVNHYNTSFGSPVYISALLNGSTILDQPYTSTSLDAICASKPGPGQTAIRNRVKLHYISSTVTDTTLGVVVINENASPLEDASQIEIFSYSITITTGTSIDLAFTKFYHDTATGTVGIIEQKVKAFNPSKITI